METDMQAHRIAHVPQACDKPAFNVKPYFWGEGRGGNHILAPGGSGDSADTVDLEDESRDRNPSSPPFVPELVVFSEPEKCIKAVFAERRPSAKKSRR
jgi:hypothetical protein